MRVHRQRRVRPGRPGVQEHRPDAGFGLIEVLVAGMLITITMAALTSYFVTATTVTSRQGGVQVAVQLADDAMEQVRAVDVSAILALPQTATATVNGIRYTQTWVTSKCWKPRTQLSGDCGTVRTARDAEFLRVVVTVSWLERHCATGICTYTTSTLISNASSEPFFDSDQG